MTQEHAVTSAFPHTPISDGYRLRVQKNFLVIRFGSTKVEYEEGVSKPWSLPLHVQTNPGGGNVLAVRYSSLDSVDSHQNTAFETTT